MLCFNSASLTLDLLKEKKNKVEPIVKYLINCENSRFMGQTYDAYLEPLNVANIFFFSAVLSIKADIKFNQVCVFMSLYLLYLLWQNRQIMAGHTLKTGSQLNAQSAMLHLVCKLSTIQ